MNGHSCCARIRKHLGAQGKQESLATPRLLDVFTVSLVCSPLKAKFNHPIYSNNSIGLKSTREEHSVLLQFHKCMLTTRQHTIHICTQYKIIGLKSTNLENNPSWCHKRYINTTFRISKKSFSNRSLICHPFHLVQKKLAGTRKYSRWRWKLRLSIFCRGLNMLFPENVLDHGSRKGSLILWVQDKQQWSELAELYSVTVVIKRENGTLLWARLLVLFWRGRHEPFLLTSSLTSCFPVSPRCNTAPRPHHAPMTSTSDRPKPTVDWRETITHSALAPFSLFRF